MSHQGFEITFKEFKEQFYSKIGDGSIFNVGDINLLKVVLDGLKVKYLSRGRIKHFFDKPFLFFFSYLLVRSVKEQFNKKISVGFSEGKVLLGFSSRTIQHNSDHYPIYFQKLFDVYGREKFFFIAEDSDKVKPDMVLSDLTLGYSILKPKNLRFYLQLRSWAVNLDSRWSEEEKTNIRIALYLFYIDYLKWQNFLSRTKFKSALITQSYHREGFIFACKRHKLMVNELQHGLIAKEDFFYVMPQQVSSVLKRALYPDKIIVYGEYWKEILANGFEFRNGSVIVGGYFHYDKVENASNIEFDNRKRIILITTQYSIHDYFIKFIKNLSPQLTDDWLIALKPHPAESADLYASVCELKNVILTMSNIDALIERAEFVVTIFSTTIFDSLRHSKRAFSINYPLFKDYTQSLVDSGVAISIQPEENPVQMLNNNRTKEFEPKYFYGEFDRLVFDKIIL